MLGLELLVASHLLVQASAESITCPAQKNARVDVRWRSEPVKYDYSQSTDDLAKHDIASKNPYGVHVATDVGGLMSGKMQYKSGIQVSSLRYPSSQVTCLWIDKVVIDIVIDPTIHIASEHPKGSCKHVAILEHEHKHVSIDRMIVQKYMDPIRLAASAAVQKVGVVGPKADSTADDFKQKMSDYVSAAVKTVADQMYAERTKRQKAFDSKAEYDRVSAKCEPKAAAQ